MSLTADQIGRVTQTEIRTTPVEVPEWGGTAHVRVMSGKLRDRFEAEYSRDKSNIRARLATYTLCDEAGKLLFAENQVDQVGEFSGVALDRVFTAAIKINAIGAADVAELEKNSDAIPSDSSASGSPASSE